MTSVAVYFIESNQRSRLIGQALGIGAQRIGWHAFSRRHQHYREPEADLAALYGFRAGGAEIMDGYIAAGRHAVFADLGYFGRRQGGRFAGYHKVSVDARHPNAYFMARPHSDARLRMMGISVAPWRRGRNILLAGMGDKAARSYGFRPEQWERWAIDEIRKHTDRPIVYRPKPGWGGARPIEGTVYSPRRLVDALADAHAVVTHHSNTAIDGLIAGVPAFCWGGVAQPMALDDLSLIETPLYPDGRWEWLAAVCWCQFTVAEIARGVAYRHLANEGLLGDVGAPCV